MTFFFKKDVSSTITVTLQIDTILFPLDKGQGFTYLKGSEGLLKRKLRKVARFSTKCCFCLSFVINRAKASNRQTEALASVICFVFVLM